MSVPESRFDKKETAKAKGVSICLLLFHHLFYSESRISQGGVKLHIVPQELLINIAAGARVCVWIFVFLSAYGLSIKYNELVQGERSVNKSGFIKKQWFSLMKPYWFVFIIVSVVSLFIFERPWIVYKNSAINFILDSFAWADFFSTPSLCNVWWYMCLAQVVVLFVPLVNDFVKRFGYAAIPIVFVATQFLDLHSGGINSRFGGAYVNYLFSVVFGALFAQKRLFEKICNRRQSSVLRALELVFLISVTIGCIYVNLTYSQIDTWKFSKLAMSVAGTTAVIVVHQFITNRYISSAFRFIGRYAGTIFLIHSFSYMYYLKLLYWSHNVFVTWITLLVVSLLVSIILDKLQQTFWHATDKTFDAHFKRKKLD